MNICKILNTKSNGNLIFGSGCPSNLNEFDVYIDVDACRMYGPRSKVFESIIIKPKNDGKAFIIKDSNGNDLLTVDTLTKQLDTILSMIIGGPNQENKFTIYDQEGNIIFNVNTQDGSVETENNVLDDGSGNMGISGDLTVAGTLIVGSITIVDLTVNNLTVTDTANINNLIVSGDTTLEDLTINGTLNVTEMELTDLTVTGQTTLEDLTINGTLNVTEMELVDLTVTGQTTLEDLTINGTLNVTEMELTDLTVTGQTTLEDVTINGTLNLTELELTDLTVTGDSSLNNLTTTGNTELNNLTIPSFNEGILHSNNSGVVVSDYNVISSTNPMLFRVPNNQQVTINSALVIEPNTDVNNTTGILFVRGRAETSAPINKQIKVMELENRGSDGGSCGVYILFKGTNSNSNPATSLLGFNGNTFGYFRDENAIMMNNPAFRMNCNNGYFYTNNITSNSSDAGTTMLLSNISATNTVRVQGANNANKFSVRNNASQIIFNVNTTNDTVSTLNNTLDNGSGAMIIQDLFLNKNQSGYLFLHYDPLNPSDPDNNKVEIVNTIISPDIEANNIIINDNLNLDYSPQYGILQSDYDKNIYMSNTIILHNPNYPTIQDPDTSIPPSFPDKFILTNANRDNIIEINDNSTTLNNDLILTEITDGYLISDINGNITATKDISLDSLNLDLNEGILQIIDNTGNVISSYTVKNLIVEDSTNFNLTIDPVTQTVVLSGASSIFRILATNQTNNLIQIDSSNNTINLPSLTLDTTTFSSLLGLDTSNNLRRYTTIPSINISSLILSGYPNGILQINDDNGTVVSDYSVKNLFVQNTSPASTFSVKAIDGSNILDVYQDINLISSRIYLYSIIGSYVSIVSDNSSAFNIRKDESSFPVMFIDTASTIQKVIFGSQLLNMNLIVYSSKTANPKQFELFKIVTDDNDSGVYIGQRNINTKFICYSSLSPSVYNVPLFTVDTRLNIVSITGTKSNNKFSVSNDYLIFNIDTNSNEVTLGGIVSSAATSFIIYENTVFLKKLFYVNAVLNSVSIAGVSNTNKFSVYDNNNNIIFNVDTITPMITLVGTIKIPFLTPGILQLDTNNKVVSSNVWLTPPIFPSGLTSAGPTNLNGTTIITGPTTISGTFNINTTSASPIIIKSISAPNFITFDPILNVSSSVPGVTAKINVINVTDPATSVNALELRNSNVTGTSSTFPSNLGSYMTFTSLYTYTILFTPTTITRYSFIGFNGTNLFLNNGNTTSTPDFTKGLAITPNNQVLLDTISGLTSFGTVSVSNLNTSASTMNFSVNASVASSSNNISIIEQKLRGGGGGLVTYRQTFRYKPTVDPLVDVSKYVMEYSLAGDSSIGTFSFNRPVIPEDTTNTNHTLGNPANPWNNVHTKGITMYGSIIPAADDTYDLGIGNARWQTIWIHNIRMLGTIGSNFVPNNNSRVLGSDTNRWNNIYVNNTDINNLKVNTNVVSSLIPDVTNAYDLGADNRRWGTVYSNNINTINIVVSGYIRPDQNTASDLGSNTRYWQNIYTQQINGPGIVIFGNSIRPTTNELNGSSCGISSNRWGRVFAVEGTIQTSDGEDKENICECDLGLEFVEDLKPKKYNWKGKSADEVNYGIVAQDLEESLNKHNCCNFKGLHKPDPEIEGDKYGINYSQLIPILIKSIQELSAQNKLLEQRISQLEQLI